MDELHKMDMTTRAGTAASPSAAPLAGEALTSFLGRLAAANRTIPEAVLDIIAGRASGLALGTARQYD